jgi:hypothetical protein
MKNHLLIAKTNANKSKIRRAKKMLLLSLLCIFAISSMTTASVLNVKDMKGTAKTVVISASSLALVPFAANVRGTKAVNGHDESEDEFAARKGAGESDEMFAKRLMLQALKNSEDAMNKYKESESALKTLREQIEKATTPEEVKNIKEELKKHGLDIESMKEGGKKEDKTFKGQVYEFIEKNHDKIKQMKRAGSGTIEFTVKTAADIVATSNATLPVAAPALQGVQVAPPSNVNLRGTIIDSLVSSFPTTQASYAYTETLPKNGNFGFIAEKGVKSQVDMEFKTRYAAPVKAAGYMRLTEESITDIPNLQSIAFDFLRKKHDLKRQNGILFGDGNDPNPKGATTYGRAFTAGGLANKVSNPNFMDVVNAAITDIFTTHNYTDEMPYMANICLVNPEDFYIQLVAAKDGFGRALYPMASLFNQVQIGNVTIIPFEDIPSGKIFVADLSKYNITNYVGYTVRIGWINDDFIYNQFAMVGESRFHAFVKKLDEQAFIYDDIDTIKTAITAA